MRHLLSPGQLRSSTCVLLVAFTVAAGSSVPRAALGQSRASSETVRARAAFERGVQALQRQDFDAAARQFQASYAQNPTPVVLYNLGLAYRGMGRINDAIEAFERYLRHPEPGADRERLGGVGREVAGLRNQLARLTFTGLPNNASVRVDSIAQSTISGSSLSIDPGEHAIEITAEGYQPFTETLHLRAGEARNLAPVMQPAAMSARLVVEASLPTASILIDGRMAGTGRAEQAVMAGDHQVEVRAPGYATFRRSVNLRVLGALRVYAELSSGSGLSWRLPVAIGAAALVIGGSITAFYLYDQLGPRTEHFGTWGNLYEGR